MQSEDEGHIPTTQYICLKFKVPSMGCPERRSAVYLGVKYFRSLSWSLPLLPPSLAMEGALGDASVLQEAADPPLGTTLHLVAL